MSTFRSLRRAAVRFVLTVIVATLGVLSCIAAPASASLYGRGAYSQCKYSADCPVTPTAAGTTKIETAPGAPTASDANGTKIVSNVQPGQVINTAVQPQQLVTAQLLTVQPDGTTNPYKTRISHFSVSSELPAPAGCSVL